MKQLTIKYNQAIALIREGKLEEAKHLLESVLAAAPLHPQTSWALGLVETQLGDPITGLSRWERLNLEDFPQLESRREIIISNRNVYEDIRTAFNRALMLSREKNFEDANLVLSQLLDRNLPVPLPLELYKLTVIVKAANGKLEEAVELIEAGPKYIQSSPSILKIINQLQKASLTTSEVAAGVPPEPKRKLRTGPLAAGAVALAAAGLFFFYQDNSEPAVERNSEVAGEANNEERLTIEHKNEISGLQSKIASLESEKLLLAEQLDAESEKVREQEKTEEIYRKADINLETIEITKARQAFNQGYSEYTSGHLEKAIEKFELSLSLNGSQYYSDDALYYLAKAKYELNTLNPEDPLFGQFSGGTSEHFKGSPYKDDLLLIRANSYKEAGDNQKALEVVSVIKTEFPNEWTSQAAKSLEKVIGQES